MNRLLTNAADRAATYLNTLDDRPVFPTREALDALDAFDTSLPDAPSSPDAVLALLDKIGSPATVATAGGRYFGFVTGGSLPAALAAHQLASAWDQNGALAVMSPVAARLEEIGLRWLADVLGLPSGCAGGFVTGATMANLTALAAARHAILQRQGWDVEADGLFGAPPITVVVGEEVHVSVRKALGLLGLGRQRVATVAVDGQGRMRADALPPLDETTIVCTQAGNVNTGACDPLRMLGEAANVAGAWLHIDGAFGLWAAASPEHAHLVDGVELADSWATDAHKWLNTPYDCGLVFCRDSDPLQTAMTVGAAYLATGDEREPNHFVPEFSRRARGVEVWAALQALGRAGVADLVARTCRHAERFAEGLSDAGFEILNKTPHHQAARSQVELNQVLVSFGPDEITRRVIAAIQQEGTCWCGGTAWQGRAAMRISVSSWATTEADVERSLAAMVRVAREIGD